MTKTKKTQKPQPRLLDQVRERIRLRQMSRKTEKCYVGWIARYIRFHGKRHPREMAESEVTSFLTHLAAQRDVSASTQRQALCAILFLYKHVLDVELGDLDIARARRNRRLPVVLTPQEARQLLENTGPPSELVLRLLYGTGMRLLEGLRLRVKDLDFDRGVLVVREGKGSKDRVTVFPRALHAPLREQLEHVQRAHVLAMGRGFGGVELPLCFGAEIPECRHGTRLAICFPSRAP